MRTTEMVKGPFCRSIECDTSREIHRVAIKTLPRVERGSLEKPRLLSREESRQVMVFHVLPLSSCRKFAVAAADLKRQRRFFASGNGELLFVTSWRKVPFATGDVVIKSIEAANFSRESLSRANLVAEGFNVSHCSFWFCFGLLNW